MSISNNGKNLSGKTIVVTGATSGIGLAAVQKLVEAGAFVIGVGRSIERNESARKSVLALHPKGKVRYLLADLASIPQIQSLCREIVQSIRDESKNHIDVLINNAGVYLEKQQKTEEGIEKTFAVNHLAPFLLTYNLLPMLQNAKRGRVLVVSSYSHYTTPLCLQRIANPYPYLGLLAYKRSKLCNVLFIYELNRRFAPLQGFAVDPGLVNTSIASKGSQGISHWIWRNKRKKGTSPAVPVKTIQYLCSTKVIDGEKGVYFKNSVPKRPSRNAQRVDLAKDLWDISCQLTGIDWK